MKQKIHQFFNSEKEYPILTILAAGLYPFLHYYANNLQISNSWPQLVFMLAICFLIPYGLLVVSKYIFNLKPLLHLKPYRLALVNFSVFSILILFLIFDFKMKMVLVTFAVVCVLVFVLYKHLKKIIGIQLLMALMSTVSIIPLLFFAFHQNNDWAVLPSKILETELLLTPNIFVIQPDGYVNQSILNKPPYDYDNSSFYAFLDAEGFTTYDNFRSNYFSTLTSNASMFAMKHHYYSNTYKKGHKTFNANQVIVGHDNNTLNLLKHNNYSTHLLTDNSYFTIDRVPMIYDYHNVSIEDISFIKSGKIKTDMVSDLNQVLDTLNSTKNFFFIEKILPSHIARTNAQSKGIKGERDAYIMKLKRTNIWLKEVLKRIKQFDDDALVIIVADHGGFVGLHHTLESVKKPMNHVEVMSVFSSMLSIKWPKQLQGKDYDFRSNVNLFRTVFFALSDNQALLETNQDDTSHIPYYENASATYYECIDKNGNVILYGKRN